MNSSLAETKNARARFQISGLFKRFIGKRSSVSKSSLSRAGVAKNDPNQQLSVEEQDEMRARNWRRGFGGVALAGIVAAFFFAPMLRFANPALWAFGGMLSGFGIFGLYNSHVILKDHQAKQGVRVAIGIGGIGLVILTFAFVQAQTNSDALDQLCGSVQRDMIVGRTANGDGTIVKSDPATEFYSLGCRPIPPFHYKQSPAAPVMPSARG